VKNNKKKVVVAISGGLDSSAAAFILKKQGYDLIGVYFRIGMGDEIGEEYARKLCRFLDIPFFPINLSYKFKEEVVDYFINAYAHGLTPNPCVRCNKLIKFGELFKTAKELGADLMATGHYVKIKNLKNKIKIFRPLDSLKDQSYFLYNLNQDILHNILFPLSSFKKDEIRKMAQKENIPFLKSESQDICFLHQDGKIINHNDFLKKNIKPKEGLIKTLDNKVVGKHQGLHFYTIGQRKGIHLGGASSFYVYKKDYEKNILYVVDDFNDSFLFKKSFKLAHINWVSGVSPKFPFNCEVVIRYRHKSVKCNLDIFRKDSSKNNGKYIANLEESQRAISSGQSAVFYQGDELVGGGIIL